jgi:hypothetical protein
VAEEEQILNPCERVDAEKRQATADATSQPSANVAGPDYDNPRDWVPLIDSRKYLDFRFRVRLPEGLDEDLKSQIRRDRIPHRINAGEDGQKHPLPQGLGRTRQHPTSRRPLDYADERIVVSDWDAAETNWRTCTVRGRDGARWPIEVHWLAVEDWAELGARTAAVAARRANKAPAAEPQQAEGASSTSANTPKKKGSGGRPPQYKWTPVAIQIGAWLHAEGLPEWGDGGQAKLVRRAMSLFEPDSCPVESSVEDMVRQSIEAHHKVLNAKPNKPKN